MKTLQSSNTNLMFDGLPSCFGAASTEALKPLIEVPLLRKCTRFLNALPLRFRAACSF